MGHACHGVHDEVLLYTDSTVALLLDDDTEGDCGEERGEEHEETGRKGLERESSNEIVQKKGEPSTVIIMHSTEKKWEAYETLRFFVVVDVVMRRGSRRQEMLDVRFLILGIACVSFHPDPSWRGRTAQEKAKVTSSKE